MKITAEIIRKLTAAQLRVFCAINLHTPRSATAALLGIGDRAVRFHLAAIRAKGIRCPDREFPDVYAKPETELPDVYAKPDREFPRMCAKPDRELPDVQKKKIPNTNLLINYNNNNKEKEELKNKLGDGGLGEGDFLTGGTKKPKPEKSNRLAEIWRDAWHGAGVQVRITPKVLTEIRKGITEFGPADLELLIRGHVASEFHRSRKLSSIRYTIRETNVSRFLELANPKTPQDLISWNDLHLEKTNEFWISRRSSAWRPTTGTAAFLENQPTTETNILGIRCFKWDNDPKLSMSFAKFSAYRFAHREIIGQDHPPGWGDKSANAVAQCKKEFLSIFQKTTQGSAYV